MFIWNVMPSDIHDVKQPPFEGNIKKRAVQHSCHDTTIICEHGICTAPIRAARMLFYLLKTVFYGMCLTIFCQSPAHNKRRQACRTWRYNSISWFVLGAVSGSNWWRQSAEFIWQLHRKYTSIYIQLHHSTQEYDSCGCHTTTIHCPTNSWRIHSTHNGHLYCNGEWNSKGWAF